MRTEAEVETRRTDGLVADADERASRRPDHQHATLDPRSRDSARTADDRPTPCLLPSP
jgi:hypothetical protein